MNKVESNGSSVFSRMGVLQKPILCFLERFAVNICRECFDLKSSTNNAIKRSSFLLLCFMDNILTKCGARFGAVHDLKRLMSQVKELCHGDLTEKVDEQRPIW
jgi:hypothetical protein